MRKFFTNHWHWLFAIVAAWIVGFFMGRSHSEVITDIRYVKGETIHDTTYALVPEHSRIPNNPVLPVKQDTVYTKGKDSLIGVPYYITEKVDTTGIITQYITENKYSTVLFDNKEHGKMKINSTVQYNRLQGIGWDFEPITKETVIERKRTFTPFVLGSYNTFGQVGAGAGIYYHNLGASIKYINDLKSRTGYEFGVHIKF